MLPRVDLFDPSIHQPTEGYFNLNNLNVLLGSIKTPHALGLGFEPRCHHLFSSYTNLNSINALGQELVRKCANAV